MNIKTNKKKSFILPFFECLIALFFLFVGYRNFNLYSWVETLGFHPYTIAVIVFSFFYGMGIGTFNVLVASFIHIAFSQEIHNISESVYDYHFEVLSLPFFWLVLSTVLGNIRHKYQYEKEELEEKLKESIEQGKVIAETFSILEKKKDKLEKQLVSHLDVSVDVFNTISSNLSTNPIDHFFRAKDLIKKAMEPKKFSVFAFGENGFEVVLSEGWTKDDTFSRRFSLESALGSALAASKRIFCIVNLEDEKILANEGIVAAPIIDKESNQMIGMIKIEELDFSQFSYLNIELLDAICAWVGVGYTNAKREEKILQNQIYASNGLETYALYEMEVDLLENLSQQYGFITNCLKIEVIKEKEMEPNDYEAMIIKMSFLVKKHLKGFCRIYNGVKESEFFVVFCSKKPVKKEVLSTLRLLLIEECQCKEIKFTFNKQVKPKYRRVCHAGS